MANKKIPASLKVSYWNANGLLNKKNELVHYLNKHNIDVLLVNETHLKPNQIPKIRDYNFYKNDRLTKGGGVAIYIKNNLSHCELPIIPTEELEIISIQVKMKNGPLILHSVYYPPCKTFHENDIKNAFMSNSATVMAGDLNAKHSEWNSIVNNQRGLELKRLTDNTAIIVEGPLEPTHFAAGKNSSDVLDIILLKNINLQYSLETVMELSSDHHPVILTIGDSMEKDEFEVKKTNWEKFRDVLKTKKIPIIRNKNEIEEKALELQQIINDAFAAATTIKIKTKKQLDTLPIYLKELIKEKNKARRTYHRTLNPQDKTHLNYMTRRVTEALTEHQNDKWQEKMEELQKQDSNVWKIAKALKNKTSRQKSTLIKDNIVATDDIEKANLFAKTMEEQFKPYELTRKEDRKLGKFNRINLEQGMEQPIRYVEPVEITGIIKTLKKKKAAGEDGINNQMLKNLPDRTILHITALVNAVLRFQTFPNCWKKAKIIMLLKPQKKSSDPTSYRPISLLSCLSKIAERCILTRLNEELENLNVVPHVQFGFRQNHSAIQQVARVIGDMTNNLNSKKKTAAIFIDLAKGFDKVWHNGLIYKMKSTFKISTNMTRLIQSYLTERKFYVSVDNVKSMENTISAGVPQGSVLGPTLFNIYTSDLPVLTNSQVAQFADDTAIYTSARLASTAVNNLQKDINILTCWLYQWKFQLNADKSTALFVGPRKKESARPRKNININGKNITWSKYVKYLGIVIDDQLTFCKHITETQKKAKIMVKNLFAMINKKSKLSIDCKLMIYKSMILPIMLYGIETWYIASDRNIYKLQVIQNKVLRMCSGAEWFETNDQLHRDLEMPKLKDIINKRTEKFYNINEKHENPLIQSTVNVIQSQSNRFKHPAKHFKNL